MAVLSVVVPQVAFYWQMNRHAPTQTLAQITTAVVIKFAAIKLAQVASLFPFVAVNPATGSVATSKLV